MLTRNSRGNGRFPREWTVSTVLVVDVHGVATLRVVCRSNYSDHFFIEIGTHLVSDRAPEIELFYEVKFPGTVAQIIGV